MKKISLLKTLILMIVIVSILVAFTVYGIKRYENGILDICATQQDSYVQLVIDQINIKENRTDQEIIEDILSTLDSSSERYWTFSKSSTVLYVKDALETNKFQSLTADSYYTSESAKHFLDNLSENKTYHEKIVLNGKDYIASGAKFTYNGEPYRICLLTNVGVLLDNNKFLGAKIELLILFGVVYAVLFVLPIIVVILFNKSSEKLWTAEGTLVENNIKIEKLNDALSEKDIYDNRQNLFQMTALELFISKYEVVSEAFPISFLLYKYTQKETVSTFFGTNCIVLGKKDIKFYDGKHHFALLLCVQSDEVSAQSLVHKIKTEVAPVYVHTARDAADLKRAYKEIQDIMAKAAEEEAKAPAKRVLRPDNRTEAKYRQEANIENIEAQEVKVVPVKKTSCVDYKYNEVHIDNLCRLSEAKHSVEKYDAISDRYPIALLAYRYQESGVAFYENNCPALGKNDIRFYDDEAKLAVVLCEKCDHNRAINRINWIGNDIELLGTKICKDFRELKDHFGALLKSAGYNGEEL